MMRNPLSWLNGLWSSRQGHEVAFDNVLSITLINPEGLWIREVVSGKRVVEVRVGVGGVNQTVV